MDNKTKNWIVAAVLFFLLALTSFFATGYYRQDGNLNELRIEVNTLEIELKKVQEDLQDSESALEQQKEYIKILN